MPLTPDGAICSMRLILDGAVHVCHPFTGRIVSSDCAISTVRIFCLLTLPALLVKAASEPTTTPCL